MEKEKEKGGDAFGDMVGGDEGERKKVLKDNWRGGGGGEVSTGKTNGLLCTDT